MNDAVDDAPDLETETLVGRATAAFTAYRDGDRAAFDRLVEEMTPMLWHVVRAQGVDTLQAEDIIQTTWMHLCRTSGSIQDSRSVVKWLITTAKREAWRVSGRSRADVARSTPLVDDEGQERDVLPAPRQYEPDAAVLQGVEQKTLWRQVAKLSERCRELIRVIAFADRPDYASIAEALGMPVGSIGPTRGRCLAKLRAALEQDPTWEVGV